MIERGLMDKLSADLTSTTALSIMTTLLEKLPELSVYCIFINLIVY